MEAVAGAVSGLMLFTLVMLFDQFARAIQRLWPGSDVC